MTSSDVIAAVAGLRYVDSSEEGYRRVRKGRGFSYLDGQGSVVNGSEREWIQSLVIPPAWEDVWISPDRNGHILATGHDQAGRKQYIYHPRWEEARDEVKFERVGEFGRRLPSLRRSVDTDLRRTGLPREKVVALAVAVLDRTLIRVGNRRYAMDNDSYGLTTLTRDHLDVEGLHVHLYFNGKGQAEHELAFRDRRLASLISKCQELAGQTLFSYESAPGEIGSVQSADINGYLAEATGSVFTAKDFRTWGASALVTGELAPRSPDGEEEATFLEAIDVAAERLGNTREVCRDSYVHPEVQASWRDGRLSESWKHSRSGKWVDRSESALRLVLESGS